MTPAKLALVIKCATAIAQHRGRTVPAITSFSARCLMSPVLSGVQCANVGGGHEVSPPNANIIENVFLSENSSDLALSRSPVRVGAPFWDGRAQVEQDTDGFRKELQDDR